MGLDPKIKTGSLGQYGVHAERKCSSGDLVFITKDAVKGFHSKTVVGSEYLLFSLRLGNSASSSYCFTHFISKAGWVNTCTL